MADLPQREVIMAKAGELFHRHGYGSVSIEDIILESKLPKAAFYQHFTTKDSIGCFWLDRLARRMAVMHRGFLKKLGDKDRRLRKYFLSMASWSQSNGFRSCQFANTAASIGDGSEELYQHIDQYKRAQLKFFIELVGTIVAERDAQRLGTAVYLLYSGAMTEAQNLKAMWPLEDALTMAEEICGIRSKP